MVHDSASADTTTADEIRGWHEDKGWSDVGHHYGNYVEVDPPEDLWNYLIGVVETLIDEYDRPPENVVGHKEVMRPGTPSVQALIRMTCGRPYWRLSS